MVPSARSSLALALASLIIISAPREALAAPAASEAEAPSTTEQAETKFRAGQTKYETADYDAAIELWTEAYGLVESSPENAAIKALLIFNLAQAHVKAFELHEDTLHLKKARALLESYRASLELLYADETARADENAKVDATLADIAAKLDAAEAERAPEPEPTPAPPPPQVDAPPSNPSPGNPLLFAGIGVTVLGVAMGGVGLGLGAAWASNANDVSGLEPSDLDAREQQFARGRRGNMLMVAGGVIAGVLIPTGVGLLTIGAKRNAEARRARQARVPQLVPSFGPAGGGLVLTGRF